MKIALLIACGGGCGSLLRYAVAGLGQRLVAGTFPIGTLLVNVLGCLVIGWLGAVLSGPWLVREEVRLALLIGLLGGFTTFSTFGWETITLVNDGQIKAAMWNVLLSNALGLAAVFLGYRVAQQWPGG